MASAPASTSAIRPAADPARAASKDGPGFDQLFGQALGHEAARAAGNASPSARTAAHTADAASHEVAGREATGHDAAGKSAVRGTIKSHAAAESTAARTADADSASDDGQGAQGAQSVSEPASDPSSGTASEPSAETREHASDRSDDPATVLGWLQSQTGQGALAPAAGSGTGALVLPTPAGQTGGPFAAVGIAKNAASAGDTPPIFVPNTPSAAALGSAAAGDDGRVDCPVASFNVADLGPAANDASGTSNAAGTALTPALSAALAAALSAAGTAAPEVITRGVEQFQALMAHGASAAAAAVSVPVNTPAASATPSVQTLLGAPLATDSPDLPVRLGERLQWLVDSGLQEARMQLHPRELGTVNVQVRVDAKGTSVWFAAEHPAARAALESALPQLRERMANDGVNLAQTQVAAQTSGWSFGGSPQQGSQQGSSRSSSDTSDGSTRLTQGLAGDARVGDDGDALTVRSTRGTGLVDRYA